MTKSPRRLTQHVRDAVSEQVRDLPLHAVRLAMFGVGRALLLSDRVTRDYKEMREKGVGPVLGRLGEDAKQAAEQTVGKVAEKVATLVRGEESEPRTDVQTPVATPPGHRPRPRPRSVAEIAVGKPAPKPAARPAPDAEPAGSASGVQTVTGSSAERAEAAGRADEAGEGGKAPAERGGSGPVLREADLPVPNYDEASLPQLRARLRGLTVEQVELLREYERQHAARPEILRMYDNRIAKLRSGG